jgi:hypothetical protein
VRVERSRAANEFTVRSCAATCAVARIDLAGVADAEIAHRTFRFEGRSFEHIIFASAGARFEAIVAHGAATAAFAGPTGLVGDPLERRGVSLSFTGEPAVPTSVDLSTVREGTRVCGEGAPAPMATRTLKGTGFVRVAPSPLSAHRIAKAQSTRPGGQFVPAPVAIWVPVSSTRAAAALSVGGSLAQGEFVTLRAPKLAIERVHLAFAPAAVERPLWLASHRSVYRLVLPRGATQVVLALPSAEVSTCWSLVAAAPVDLRGAAARPVLFERASTPPELAALIVASDRYAIEAAEALRLFGTQGAVALDARMSDIPEAQLGQVEGALSALSCEALVSPMAKLGARASGETARRARHQLERCARSALDEAVKVLAEPSPHGLLLGDVLRSTAPTEVCRALLHWPGKVAPALRRKARTLLSRVAKDCDRRTVEAALAGASGEPRTDLLAAFRNIAGDISPALLSSALGAIDGDFDSRWMAIAALDSLAVAGDRQAIAALEVAAKSQADAALRALACRGLSEARGNREALLRAARDPDPRVREAALLSLEHVDGEVLRAAISDPWAFVRQAAALHVGDAELLRTLLGDRVVEVRIAALRAAGAGKRTPFVPTIVSMLKDPREPIPVRREAAAALGSLCSPRALDGLAEVAASAANGTESDRELGVDVLRAIAVLDEARALALSRRWPPRAASVLALEARDARRTQACPSTKGLQ